MSLPLSDIRVVDFASAIAGPGGARFLADHGAEVIKVEPPGGDRTRQQVPNYNGLSHTFLTFNRNKRSIVVDITKPAGLEVAHRLIRWADVMVTNTRVGARRRRGLNYEAVADINPRLVYASLTAYGEEGPDADLPGSDQSIQARAGDIAGRRPLGGAYPDYTHLAHFDVSSGMLLAYGVMVALHEREFTGRGQKVEVNLLQAGLTLHPVQMTRLSGTNVRREIRATGLPMQYMCDGGRQILCSPSMNDGPRWEQFLRAIGLEGLVHDPKFDTLEKREQRLAELQEVLARHFTTKPAAEWEAILQREKLNANLVKEIELGEVDDDPQVIANQMIIEFQQPGLGPVRAMSIPFKLSNHTREPWLRRHVPTVGEHTSEVIQELGYSAEEMNLLKKGGAIA